MQIEKAISEKGELVQNKIIDSMLANIGSLYALHNARYINMI
jgi:hypothetical protein